MPVKTTLPFIFFCAFFSQSVVHAVVLNPPAQELVRVLEQTFPIPERPNSQTSHFTILLKIPTDTTIQGAVTVALGQDVNEDSELGVEETVATADLVAQTQTDGAVTFERKTVGDRQFLYAKIPAANAAQYDALHISARGELPAMNLRFGWEGQPLKIILF